MMKLMRLVAGVAIAALMTACGGGGGSAGTVTGGSGSGGGSTTPTATPTLTLSLLDSAGLSTNTISNTTTVYAKAVAKDAAGAPLAGTVVTFTSGSTATVRFVPDSGTALTGADGAAVVQVLPASSSSSGADVLTAKATLSGKDSSTTASYQIPSGVSDPATSKVTNFVMLLDKSTLPNTGTATAKLTVLAVDAGNNIVSGAAVKVTTDANTVFVPNGSVTDASGQFTGAISAGSDKSDRTVTITSTVNSIVKQTTLKIAGSALALSSTPTVLNPGAAAVFTARLTDASAQPISGATLSFSGDIASISGKSAQTDSTGAAALNFTAPSTSGSYIVLVTGNGITSSITLQVGSSVSIPVAVIPNGVQPALSALPNVVAPNSAGSTSSQSQLRFLFLDSNNQPIPNVRVRFEITSTGLGSFDSTISSGSSTVYTSASGVATANFIPGSTGSPTDGVKVRACYQAGDFTTATQCVNSVTVSLTVAQQALAVSIGDDNLLARGNGTYIKKFAVTVADAAGRAVPNASIDISVDIPYYGKGPYADLPTFPLLIQPIAQNASIVGSLGTTRSSCINEDLNRNGFVDPGENINNSLDSFGQPTLEPRRSDIIISYSDPAVKVTDANGLLVIQVEYSQRLATWEEYHVRASTTVAGSQGSAERAFVTGFIKGDDTNGGSFLTPPYGTAACTSPN